MNSILYVLLLAMIVHSVHLVPSDVRFGHPIEAHSSYESLLNPYSDVTDMSEEGAVDMEIV
jgi:hypothetical protein